MPQPPRFASARLRLRALGAALIVAVAAGVAGADNARLDAANGLPTDGAAAVLQDRYGFVWTATSAGLVRWDGHRVRTFVHEAGNTRSIPSDDVRTLFKGRSGNLWVGTAEGLVRYEPAGSTFRAAQTSESGAPSTLSAPILGVLEDGEGRRWIATERGLLYVSPAVPGVRSAAPLEGQPVTALAAADGALWVGSERGVARVTIVDGVVEVAPESLADGIGRVRALAVDGPGALWVGGEDGLVRLDVKRRERRKIAVGGAVLSLLLSDDGGLLWVGTDRGLEALTVGAETEFGASPLRLDGRRIHHLAAGRSGQIWAATDAGLYGLPRANAAFHLEPEPPSVTFTGLQVDGDPVTPSDAGPLDRELAISEALELPAASRMITLELAALRFDRLVGLRYSYRLMPYHDFWQETGADRPQAVYSALPPGAYRLEARAAFGGEPWGEAATLPLVITASPARGAWAAFFALLAALATWLAVREVRLAKARRDDTMAARLREMQEQKVESLATLAGGVAHDFNNLLVGIFGHAELAKLSVGPESPARAHLERILTSARRAGELSKQMLFYSGRAQFVVEPLQIRELVEDAVASLRPTADERVRVLVEGDDELPVIDGDAGQLRQVISNLVVNAFEALDGRDGFVVVGVRAVDCDDEFLAAHGLESRLAPGRYVSITVDDTAGGIDEASLGRIFDPFYSTKSPGRGLGLAAAQGIAQGHGGVLRASTVPGRGSTFQCLLPVSSDAESSGTIRGVDASPSPTPGGRGLALIVESSPEVRRVARESLEKLGFQAVEATDHASAMSVFARQRFRLTLVVLDLQVNGAGLETLREIRRLEPALPVVLTGVASEDDALRHLGGEATVTYVEKPLRQALLHKAVRENVADGDIN
ncbi:MAG: ATP-binding protein [Acidobacteriota bacterium]